LEPEKASLEDDGTRIKFYPDDECDNESKGFKEGDEAILYRFEQGLDLEMLIKAPAILMTIVIDKFATDGTVIESMNFKNNFNTK